MTNYLKGCTCESCVREYLEKLNKINEKLLEACKIALKTMEGDESFECVEDMLKQAIKSEED